MKNTHNERTENKRDRKSSKKWKYKMQPFSFHCCHKYREWKKNDDKIYYTSTKAKQRTHRNEWIYNKKYEKPHNDGSKRRCWKQTNDEINSRNETTWLGKREYNEASVPVYVYRMSARLQLSLFVCVCVRI